MTVCPHCGQESLTPGPVCPLCQGDMRHAAEGWPDVDDDRAPPTPSPDDDDAGLTEPRAARGVLVYSHPVLANVAIVKTALEAQGVASEIRGAYSHRMTHAVTEVELWIADDSQQEQARAIVRVAGQPPEESASWRCSECGEDVEGQYGQCWSCGADRPQRPS